MKKKIVLGFTLLPLMFVPLVQTVSCSSSGESNNDEENKRIANEELSKIHLSNLGEFYYADDLPTIDEIRKALKAKNYSLDESKVMLKGTPTTSSCVIYIMHKGQVSENKTISYETPSDYSRANKLWEKVTDFDLGPITVAGTLPTIEELRVIIKEQNPNVDETKLNLSTTNRETYSYLYFTHNGTDSMNRIFNYTLINDAYRAKEEMNKMTVTNLGEITIAGRTPTIGELSVLAKAKNPTIDESKLVLSYAGSTSASVYFMFGTSKSQSKLLTYTIKPVTNAQKADAEIAKLTNTNLGEINCEGSVPTIEELRPYILTANPTIDVNRLRLLYSNSSTSARIEAYYSSGFNGSASYNSVEVRYTVNTSSFQQVADEEIAKLTVVNLGEIVTAYSTPSSSELRAAIKAKNPTINESKIVVEGSATSTNAVVKAQHNGIKSTEAKMVSYTVKTLAQLAEEEIQKLTVKELGNLVLSSSTPSLTALKTEIKKLNPTIDETMLIISGSATSTYANMKIRYTVGSNWSDSTTIVKVTYTITTHKQLANAEIAKLTTTDLGVIITGGSVPTIEQLRAAIKAKNPAIDESKIILSGVAATNGAFVKAQYESSTSDSTVTLTYTVN